MIFQTVQHKLDFSSKLLAVILAFTIPLSTSATDVLFVIVPILGLLGGNFKEKFRMIFHNHESLLFLILFILLLIGTTYSTATWRDSIYTLSKYDKFFWGALMLPIFREEKWRRYAIWAFLTAMMLMLVVSYLKAFGIIKWRMDVFGPVEAFKRHIEANFLMAFTAYVLLLQIAEYFHKRWWLVFVFILVTINVFFLSIGRDGYVLLAILFLLFAWQMWRWRGLIAACIVTAVLLAGAFSLSNNFRDRVYSIGSDITAYHVNPTANTSLGNRFEFAKTSLTLIKKHPFFGTGTGSFITQYAAINPQSTVEVHNPHNEYLHFGVQLGMIGMLALILLFIFQWIDSYALPRQMRFLAQALVLTIAIGSFANSWILDTVQGHFYCYFTALIFAAYKKPKRSEVIQQQP